jgi:drug/metabolite transporter (DMT)-like permease
METGSYLKQPPEVVDHERTYKAFSILMRWSMVLLGTTILTLTLWFATDTGWLGALFTGVVAFALGYWFVIRHEEKQPLDVWEEGR